MSLKSNNYCTFGLNLLLGPWKSRILHSSKQDYSRSGKNNNLSQLWHCLMMETSGDMFYHRLLNKKHRNLTECHFEFKIHKQFSNLEFQNQ
jgi:hypothetical protein